MCSQEVAHLSVKWSWHPLWWYGEFSMADLLEQHLTHENITRSELWACACQADTFASESSLDPRQVLCSGYSERYTGVWKGISSPCGSSLCLLSPFHLTKPISKVFSHLMIYELLNQFNHLKPLLHFSCSLLAFFGFSSIVTVLSSYRIACLRFKVDFWC